MKNTYYYKNEKIIKLIPKGRYKIWITESGIEIKTKDLKKPLFSAECQICGELKIMDFYNGLERKKYVCKSCCKTGDKNPFYGKRHSEETKKKQKEKKKGVYGGKDNPFYGKRHSEETKKKISELNRGKRIGKDAPFYGRRHTKDIQEQITKKIKLWRKNLTEEEKRKISKKMSDGQKRRFKEDKKYYSKIKREAWIQSQKSNKRYQKNNLEKDVEKKLLEMGIELEYSVILGYHQYDFGHKKTRILLEVQGDYWHGNPEIYNEDGSEGKRVLNEMQKKNILNDICKKQFADKNELKIFFLWEKDFRGGDFTVLENIKREIEKYEI